MTDDPQGEQKNLGVAIGEPFPTDPDALVATLQSVINGMEVLRNRLRVKDPTTGRRLSVAITEAETALLWLLQALGR